jgi:hypothetical protein
VNWFAWLERADGTYVQLGLGVNAGVPDGRYSLEHRDGSTERHVRVVIADLDVAVTAFRAFAIGDESWRTDHSWTEI